MIIYKLTLVSLLNVELSYAICELLLLTFYLPFFTILIAVLSCSYFIFVTYISQICTYRMYVNK